LQIDGRGAQPSGRGDAQIAVERDKDGNVIATVEHMKDAEAGAVLASKLERVELGIDTDGDPISSCIVVPIEGGAAGLKAHQDPNASPSSYCRG
jgi:hypothetical protein